MSVAGILNKLRLKIPSLLKFMGRNLISIASLIKRSMYSVSLSSEVVLRQSTLCPVSRLCSVTADFSNWSKSTCPPRSSICLLSFTSVLVFRYKSHAHGEMLSNTFNTRKCCIILRSHCTPKTKRIQEQRLHQQRVKNK